ncbi:MAG: glycosyltransferase family 4 protein, partial [Nitrospira sp.]|nr:glycosyltransferase family 4 protein [Nitrospira sp.]
RLWAGEFPEIKIRWHQANETVPEEIPCENQLKKNKPRLLMIVPWLTIGGADKFNLDVLKQLAHRGWEVTIATTLTGDHSWLPEFARYTPDIFILHHFLRLVDYPRFLRYLIHSREVDVVMISNSELGYLLLPYLRHHFPKVTFLDVCHMEEENWKNGGYARMGVEYQPMLDLNVVSSQHLKQWMSRRGSNPEHIEVCYTNIDLQEWYPDLEQRREVRQELGLDPSVPVVLYVGRLCAQKQPRVLAKTVLRLKRARMKFVTFVVGDGPEMGWLRSFIHKHRLGGWVRLLGSVSNQRMRQLMVASDIFFLPSQWEGIALSIYGAMACGLAVVGADVGGQRELVTPECGFLIERGEEEEEVQRYGQVLGELLRDEKRRKEMGEAGMERLRGEFGLEQMGERMERLLERAMELHESQWRGIPGEGISRVCASQAVEYTRLFQLSEQLWMERYNASWRARIYLIGSWLLEPFYNWGVNRGWIWLPLLKEKIKQVFMPST